MNVSTEPVILKLGGSVITDKAADQGVVREDALLRIAKEVSDHIVFMEQGVIVEEGTPDELFSSENARVREFIGKVSA